MNFNRKQESLKISWIQKAFSEKFDYVYELLNQDLGTMIWQLQHKFLAGTWPLWAKGFWPEVLCAWAKLHYRPLLTAWEAYDEIIWYNSCILVNNKPLWNQKAFNAGLIRVSDLFNENLHLLNYESFTDKYGECMTWFEHRQLLSALPSAWVKFNNGEAQDCPQKIHECG